MATFTTKLSLRKPNPVPVTGDLVDASADLNTNWDKVDAAIGTAVCTSTTRPSTPFVGQPAYETDTIATIVCISTGPAVWRYTTVPKVASVAARNALTPYAAMRVFRQDIGMEQWYDGSNWFNVGPTRYVAIASSDLTLGTSDGDIAGATVTLTTSSANALAKVQADFDWRLTATGTGYCYGNLYVNGVLNTKQALFTAQSAETRLCGHMDWDVVLPTAGSYTLKLRGHKDINAGTAFFCGASTKISIDLVQF